MAKEKGPTHWTCKCPQRMSMRIFWCSRCGASNVPKGKS